MQYSISPIAVIFYPEGVGCHAFADVEKRELSALQASYGEIINEEGE